MGVINQLEQRFILLKMKVMTTYPILVDMSQPLTPSETITFERLKSRYNYQPVGPHRTDRQQLNDLLGMACYDDDYDDV